MSDYFSDLESLLQESFSEKESRKALPKPPKAHRPHESGKKAKIEDPAKPVQWMNAAEAKEYFQQVERVGSGYWKTEAAVAMFATQLCLSCGSQHTHFEGFFFYQTCRDQKSARWERAKDTTALRELPKYRKVTLHEADCCTQCASTYGYIGPHPSSSEPSHATWTPHQGNKKYSDQLEYTGGFGSSHKI